MNHNSDTKYWSWLGVLSFSVLFWAQLAWMLTY
ncbi:small membrane protein YmiC [Superficieibacter sp. 1612_C1]|nr:small membrane protein YmiC [Superficieibacter sp. 1612_C1]